MRRAWGGQEEDGGGRSGEAGRNKEPSKIRKGGGGWVRVGQTYGSEETELPNPRTNQSRVYTSLLGGL